MEKFRTKIATVIVTGLTISLMMANANAAENNITYTHEDWAGAYFGLHFGSGSGDVDTSFNQHSQFTSTNFTSTTSDTNASQTTEHGKLSGNISGSIADLFVGYNFHINSLPHFIFGGQLEGTFFSDITLYSRGITHGTSMNIETILPDGIVNSGSSTFTELTEYTDELRSMFTFLARVGYLVQPNILIYMLGGGVEGNFVYPSDDFYGFGDQRSLWKLGYTAGVGLEYRFGDNWSMQGEYRFIHFDIDRNPSEPGNSAQFSQFITSVSYSTFHRSYDTDFDYSMGKIGIVYRFDSPRMSFK